MRSRATASSGTEGFRALSVAAQNAHIKRAFPSFRQVFDAGFAGRPYKISIVYHPAYIFDSGAIQYTRLSVRVIAPEIGIDPRGTGERPPHIYVDPDEVRFSLCLFDPREDEWSASRSIAETIIPWVPEWLFWFEAWLLSGIWSGGGAHPGDWNSECHTNSLSCPAPPARSLAAASNRIGRLSGTFASFRLMAEASGGYSPPEFSLISSLL